MKQILILWLFTFTSFVKADLTPYLKYSLSGSGSFYPYFTHNPEKPGIFPETVEAILSHAEIRGENLLLPAKRTNAYLEQQQIDFDIISPDWLNDEQKKDPRYIYSEPILSIREYIVTRPSHPPALTLTGKKVGTVRGYYYHDDNQFHRVDFASERELLLALKLKRIDYIIIGDLPAQYWSEQLGVAFIFNQLHSEGMLAFRLLAKHKKLLKPLNQAIAALKQAGEFERIERQYTSTLPLNKNTPVNHALAN
ncbi:transporter substrate-binding domain-containing protein [Pseudoalteromonas sp. McH1-7]|uniref:substrate-binding periplasmic protein n=1 Tax=Pseudoalteromonas sp. McH1-7 TaxID=2745574 RepID=UPI00159148F1|nr:transporter substrate-binding domain-containing protein [Pseudoalteromonas sp. McH1-7]NUZ10763.1 transporter substrate-binding domain-containing protein [Pseudoalteromonas sp. McH1-7]